MIGRMLGGFRIVEQIGMGGMATVFKAYDASTDRYVAIKTLPQQYYNDPSFRSRFEQEARAIAKLEHIHILPMFAYGDEDGIAYMVMRYLETGTLKDLIQKENLSLERIAAINKQIANALDYAHSQQIIHRDIKPSNILIDKQGNVFLTDFGIAKIVESSLELTGTGIVGTPHYMSPEQFIESSKITAASDQYSLAVVLYEMLTGRTPYQAETPIAILQQQLGNAPFPPPSSLAQGLNDAAEAVLLKALSHEPQQRYPNCSQFADAFSKAIEKKINQAPKVQASDEPATIIPSAKNQLDGATSILPPPPKSSPNFVPILSFVFVIIFLVFLIWQFYPTPPANEDLNNVAPESIGENTEIALETSPEVTEIILVTTIVPSPSATLTPSPTLTLSPSPSRTPSPAPTLAPRPEASFLLPYDDFERESLEYLRWNPIDGQCRPQLEAGILSFLDGFCVYDIGYPNLRQQSSIIVADLQLGEDIAAEDTEGIALVLNHLEGRWFAACGIGKREGQLSHYFYLLEGDSRVHEIWTPISENRWYEFSLNFNHETGNFSCSADDEAIGEYIPATIGSLGNTLFQQRLVVHNAASIDKVSSSAVPGVGTIDMPSQGQNLRGLEGISGWILVSGNIERVDIVVDGLIVDSAQFGLLREDIAEAYPEVENAENAAFSRQLFTRRFENGANVLEVWVTTREGLRFALYPDFVAINIDN